METLYQRARAYTKILNNLRLVTDEICNLLRITFSPNELTVVYMHAKSDDIIDTLLRIAARGGFTNETN